MFDEVIVTFILHMDKQRFTFKYDKSKPSSDYEHVIEYNPEDHDISIHSFTVMPALNIVTASFTAAYFDENGENNVRIAKKTMYDAVTKSLKTVLSNLAMEVTDPNEKKDTQVKEPDKKDVAKEQNKTSVPVAESITGDKLADPINKPIEQVNGPLVTGMKQNIKINKISGNLFEFLLDAKKMENLKVTFTFKKSDIDKKKLKFYIPSKAMIRDVDYVSSERLKVWVNGNELKPKDEIEFFKRIFPQIKVELDLA
jgi:hypothetical protein